MNASFVKVSIIIVNYNFFKVLIDCIESVNKFTNGIDYEIIIVDNNSTEGDIEEVIKNYTNVKLIKNLQNEGFARANNQGFAIASGDYFLVLNNDTVFLENTLIKMIEFSQLHNDGVLIGCKLLNSDYSNQLSCVDFDSISNLLGENLFIYKLLKHSRYINRYHLNYLEFSSPVEVDIIKGAFIFGHRSIFEELKGFDERFYFFAEETDLCYRFKKNDGKIFFYPGSAIIHIGGATTDTLPWFKFKNQSIAKIQIIQKQFHSYKKFIAILLHYFGLLIRVPIYFFMGLIVFRKELILKSFYYMKSIFIYPKNVF